MPEPTAASGGGTWLILAITTVSDSFRDSKGASVIKTSYWAGMPILVEYRAIEAWIQSAIRRGDIPRKKAPKEAWVTPAGKEQ
jgi:hypothetical protein